ncbi:MAG: hypothetical protein IJ496_10760 [Ruminococcus sp.]|nr:hypothetical protein [Ruminococcus sp.]
MKKRCKLAAGLSAAILAVLPLSGAFTASAATQADVIAAAEAAGWPDWMIQSAVTTFAGGNFTPEQYDRALEKITQYDEAAAKQIQEQLGITPPSSVTTPADTPSGGTAVQGGNNSSGNGGNTSAGAGNSSGAAGSTSSQSRPSDKDFIHMTLEEKKAWLGSLSEEERQAFASTMTDAERNSILKQLSASDKAALLSSFMDVGAELGITFNIDELTSENVSISAYDEEGRLVNMSSMSMTIDPTGHSYTVPIAAGTGLLLVSAGGMLFLLRRKRTE